MKAELILNALHLYQSCDALIDDDMNPYIYLIRLSNIWRFVWLLGLRRDPCQVPSFARHPIHDSRMRRDSVVPNNDRLRRPADASLVVNAATDVIEQELEQILAFLLLQAIDAARDYNGLATRSESRTMRLTSSVHKQCFFTRCRVRPD